MLLSVSIWRYPCVVSVLFKYTPHGNAIVYYSVHSRVNETLLCVCVFAVFTDVPL